MNLVARGKTTRRLTGMSKETKLLVAALRMALRDPGSVGQRSLSMALGTDDPPRPRITHTRRAC